MNLIDEKRLKEYRAYGNSNVSWPDGTTVTDLLHTLEALWKDNAELIIQAERIFPLQKSSSELALDNLRLSFRNEKLEAVAWAAEKVHAVARTYDERVQDMRALGVSLAALHEPSEEGEA